MNIKRYIRPIIICAFLIGMMYGVASLLGLTNWCIQKVDSLSNQSLNANANFNGNLLIAAAGFGAYRIAVMNQDCYYGLKPQSFYTRLELVLGILGALLAYEIGTTAYNEVTDRKKKKGEGDNVDRSEPTIPPAS